ncbi:MAG: hypothetical protein JXR49_08205 [Acidobacteria bacterium]|nr:hypothetical protein [Acidobacteriota bacterium]
MVHVDYIIHKRRLNVPGWFYHVPHWINGEWWNVAWNACSRGNKPGNGWTDLFFNGRLLYPAGDFSRTICRIMRGRDTHGPTAVMRSALRIDQDPYQATLMNMKFHPSVLQSDEDLRKLSALIKTYLGHGGKHVQFNVVSREVLLKAQQNPAQYRDLVVRVAGYSAYFTPRNHAIQDEVIARTELTRISREVS